MGRKVPLKQFSGHFLCLRKNTGLEEYTLNYQGGYLGGRGGMKDWAVEGSGPRFQVTSQASVLFDLSKTNNHILLVGSFSKSLQGTATTHTHVASAAATPW